MKYIHLFIASSIVEFEHERNALGNYIRSLNDLYVPRGIYFMLTMCENLSPAVELAGKQNFYNEKIKGADYFYVIFGNKAGNYTLQEFDVAMEQFRASGKPRVYTYFKQLSEENVSQEVLSFMKRLDRELGHYYSMFTHIDSIKLNILLELSRDPRVSSELAVQNGQVCLGNDTLLSLENIPVYAKNQELKTMRQQMKELDEAFAKAAADYGSAPANAELLQKMMELGHKRGQLADMVRQVEKDIFDLYTSVTLLKNEGRPLNWWEREASRLLELGNSEGALQILRDVQLQKELEQAKDMADANIERIRSVIHAKKMAIQVLRTRGLTAQTVGEIYENFDQIAETAEQYHIEMDALEEYASFAYDQNDFEKALHLTSRLLDWYRYTGEQDKTYIRALSLQSILFAKTSSFEKAEKGFLTLVELYEKQDGSEEQRKALGTTKNSLGMLMCTTNRLKEGEAYCLEAIRIFQELVEENPSAHNREHLANAYDTLSQIYDKMDRYEEARKLSERLHGILKELAKEDPEEFTHRYASSCAHYGLVLSSPKTYAETEALFLEALEIFQRLAKDDPGQYLPKVVWIMYLLGGHYYDRSNEKSYRYYTEAFEILMGLPEENRDYYTVDTTKLCSNLSVLLVKRGETDRAEKMFLQVLERREALYAEHPELYTIPLGDCYNNLLLFYKNAKKYPEALHYAEKARELIEGAVTAQETPPARLLKLLAIIYNNLGSLYHACMDHERADVFTLQSSYIFGRLRKMYGSLYDRDFFRSADACAAVYIRQENHAEAERLLWEAYEYFRQLGEPCHEISNIAAHLMNYCVKRNDLDRCEQIQREVLRLMEQGYANDPLTYGLSYAQACNNVASTLSRRKDAHERIDELCHLYGIATQIFRELCEAGHDAVSQYFINIYGNLLNALRVKKDTDSALALLESMAECLQKLSARNAGVYEPLLALVYYDYANIVTNTLHDKEQGRKLLHQSLDLAEKHPRAKNIAQTVRNILETHFS
ncbi:MAG: tetratricopeptide repeat protein [Oscillospiraceae bacterium]|nr:tetratricopeptide repeat protein [Oscillospiraceae bacterium]